MSTEETQSFRATKMNGRVKLEEIQDKYKKFGKERASITRKACLPEGNFSDVPIQTIAQRLRIRPGLIYHVDRAAFTMHTLIILLRDGSQRNLII